MEIIKKSIENNELVKWEKSSVIDYRIKIIKSFTLIIISVSGLMALLGLFFWYIPRWEGTFYLLWTNIEVHPLIIYLTIFSIFYSMAIFIITYAIREVIQKLRRLDIKLLELRAYNQIHLLTDKRWIQKDFRSLLDFEGSNIPLDVITRKKDIVFISLNNIQKVTVKKIRSNYNINFHFKNDSSLIQYPSFTVKFKFNDYQELKRILSQIIPLEIVRD
jgi:hypothetical protein